MTLTEIGTIRTPFPAPAGAPIQPAFTQGRIGEVVLGAPYRAGLDRLDGFSHVWLIYGFHLQEQVRLTVRPFMGDHDVGVFASRSPCRPNPLGLTLVRVVGATAGGLSVEGVDMVDGSPLYDLKPFFGRLEVPVAWRTGWLDEARQLAGPARVADDRFARD